MTSLKTPIKVILAICLLIAVFNPPYGFYQFLRISITIGLVYFIYSPSNHKYYKLLTIIYLIGVILFQPFEKINFEKNVWLIIDMFFALTIVTDIILAIKIKKNE